MPANASISISEVGQLEGFRAVKGLWSSDSQYYIRYVTIDGSSSVATVIFSDAATADAMIAELASSGARLNGRVPVVKRLGAAEDRAATSAAESEIAERLSGRQQAESGAPRGVRAMAANASLSLSGVGRLEGFRAVKELWGADAQYGIRYVTIDGSSEAATVIFKDAATADAMIAALASSRATLNGRVPVVKRLGAAEDRAATQAAESEIAQRIASRPAMEGGGYGGQRGGHGGFGGGGFRGGRGGGMQGKRDRY